MGDASQDLRTQQLETVESLKRLAVQLSELNDKESVPLSHYRKIPDSVQQSHQLMEQGAALVHACSTKYSLMGKIDAAEQQKMASDLIKGCQYVATGCLALFNKQSGYCSAGRRYVKQAARAIVCAAQQLVESFVVDHTALSIENLGAQKTGAVWQACEIIMEKKIPIGNRNAIRRDLLTFVMECNETMQEFQDLIDAGPSLKEENEEEEDDDDDDDGRDDADDAWQAFLEGEEIQYTDAELPVATACLALVKCSRGSLNVTIQACDAVGAQLNESENGEQQLDDDEDKARLAWISRLHDMAGAVGEGMTDLGACMYPPLQLETLQTEVERQAAAIETLLNFVTDASLSAVVGTEAPLDLPQDVTERVSNLQNAIRTRKQEAIEAIERVQTNNR